MAHVYMLTNDKGNVLYVGSTDNLKDRLYLHRGGFVPTEESRFDPFCGK